MSTLTDAPVLPAGVKIRQFASDLELMTRAKGGDGRTVRGIAVPWDQWIDVYGDGYLYESFRRGAVDHQFSALQRIKVADRHMYRGGTLIGVTRKAKNDGAGLYWEGYVSKTPTGDAALELANDGALDQLSVGFREVAGGNAYLNDDATGLEDRHKIIRIKVDLFEVALVPEGAYGDGATVEGIRSVPVPGMRPPTDNEQEVRAYLVGHGFAADAVERAMGALVVPEYGADDVARMLAELPKFD